MSRKLVAILAADIVGYSRLMSEDEATTLADLDRFRTENLNAAVAVSEGRIAKSMGDGWLIDFPSAAGAVRSSIALQEGLRGHARLALRVGVHIGDVTYRDEDVYGDGINIAVRLQQICAPGGIVISGSVRRSLDLRSAKVFTDLGAVSLKNIAQQMRISGWGPSAKLELPGDRVAKAHLPEKPSVAILPLDSLSPDPEHQYIADGMTENLIAILSAAPNLLVIARNSSFVFKGRPTPVGEIAERLGVRYVVEGSIQISGQRIRVTVQLIDAPTGHHMWADRYDREIDDIFDLQDEIAHKVCVELHVQLTFGETVRNRAPDVESLKLFTVGRTHFNNFTEQGLEIARQNWTAFYDKDRHNPEGLCLMGWLSWHRTFLGISDDPEKDLATAREFGECAMSIDPNHGNNYRLLGVVAWLVRDFKSALCYFDRALEIQPADGEANSIGGAVNLYAGHPHRAEELLMVSLRLEPYSPTWIHQTLATCRLVLGKTGQARASFRAIAQGDDDYFVQACLCWLVATAVEEKDRAETSTLTQTLLERFPSTNVDQFRHVWLSGFENPGLVEKYARNLRRVGIPVA